MVYCRIYSIHAQLCVTSASGLTLRRPCRPNSMQSAGSCHCGSSSVDVPPSWLIRRAGKLTVQSTPRVTFDGLHGHVTMLPCEIIRRGYPNGRHGWWNYFTVLPRGTGGSCYGLRRQASPKSCLRPGPFVTQPATRFIRRRRKSAGRAFGVLQGEHEVRLHFRFVQLVMEVMKCLVLKFERKEPAPHKTATPHFNSVPTWGRTLGGSVGVESDDVGAAWHECGKELPSTKSCM
jgi:hypothetical protein